MVCAGDILLKSYAELHALSNFTFLRGASYPEELVIQAKSLGYSALAITDECSLAGIVRAHVCAKEQGIKLIVGSEIAFSEGIRIVFLAKNRTGYGHLSALITKGRRNAKKGNYRLSIDEIKEGLPGCIALLLSNPLPSLEIAKKAASAFPGDAWLSVELLRCGENLSEMAEFGRKSALPLAASSDVHMHVPERRALQDTLAAIRQGVPVSEAKTHPNGERHLRPVKDLCSLYPEALLEETMEIAQRCHFSLDELRYEYPEELVPKDETPISHLRKLAMEGLMLRFPSGIPEKVRNLVEHELELVKELHYESYFLTVHDIVRFARERNILCQGRGSAANSAICYALRITEVNPAHMEMLFERFISKERNEPPDIDVDFEHERREEVIQYIYGKYGRDRAALAASVITYKPKSAIRDVGKALGFDQEQLERLVKSLSWRELNESGFNPEKISLLMKLVDEIIGFPRHLSQHVGGFVISRGKLSNLVPIENAAMPERTVIQWDKDDLDAIGLLKVDILALGMLSAIRRALDLSGRQMHEIPQEDPEVYEMMGNADTTGVFQIESRAQMAMLPTMQPKCFYDLVIEVAIVRPGPIQGGMVHPYLRRRQGLEPVSYPSEEVKSVLERTLGVPIFQEQVMKLAVVAAGFTPGEADQVRRSMAAWKRKGGLEKFEQRLMEGMLERGYDEAFARQIFRQILGFGEYGFPESHAASFALLVYVSAWLKCHEPAAFACALLNSQPMGFYAPDQIIQDARRHHVEVLPVDVNQSEWECTLPSPSSIRLGLRMVKGFSMEGMARLASARSLQPFESLDHLASRAGLEKRDLLCLARAGALSGISGHRRKAYWDVVGTAKEMPLAPNPVDDVQPDLLPLTEGENLVEDYGSLGFTLGSHPLSLLRNQLRKRKLVQATELDHCPDGRIVRAAGLVINRQRPGTASGVTFLTLEDETGQINVVVWKDIAEKQRRELLSSRLLAVYGKLQRNGKVLHLIAGRLNDLTPLLGNLVTRSRDFR